MPMKILALGLLLAAAWQSERSAPGQEVPGPVVGFTGQSVVAPAADAMGAGRAAPAQAWPVQPASYQTPPAAPHATVPAPQSPPATLVATTSASRPLPARKTESHPGHPSDGGSPARLRPGSLGSLVTVVTSLVLVLGLFLVVAWMLRKASPGNTALLPKEVFELLGRAPLASRHQVHLVRCGRKLLLLSVSQSGIDTLAEIEDPAEVDRLAGLCLQAQPGSASMVFRQVFQQFSMSEGRSGSPRDRAGEIRHA